MSELKARVVAETKGGKTTITVLDPKVGRPVSQHTVSAGATDAEVRSMRDNLERKGIRTDVIERR